MRTDPKGCAQEIFCKTLASITAATVFGRFVVRNGSQINADGKLIDLTAYRKIVAIAFGKASFAMAQTLNEILGPDYLCEGILVGPTEPREHLVNWKTFVGGHPVPNTESFAAGRAILNRLAACDQQTLIFFLLSGGGSTLVEQPIDPTLTLEDFQRLHSQLVRCGASIAEINVIRKHLSATKGGRLALAAPDSLKVTLAISDVPPGEESALASGPTLPDPSTISESNRILQNYGLASIVPLTIRKLFEANTLPETPKSTHPAFAHSYFVRLLGEEDLLHAAKQICEDEGYICCVENSTDDWPLGKATDFLLEYLMSQSISHPGQPVALLAGGEVRSPVAGDGKGGRNSAFVLTCVPKIANLPVTVLSAGTDGIDGNSPAAGAVADGKTMGRALSVGLDPADFMSRSDAFTFFDLLGDAIVTGPTGNNLRDLRILLLS